MLKLTAVAALVFAAYLVFTYYQAVRVYRRGDKWAKGNWMLDLWWRWLSDLPAAAGRRRDFVENIKMTVLMTAIGIGVLLFIGYGIYDIYNEYVNGTARIAFEQWSQEMPPPLPSDATPEQRTQHEKAMQAWLAKDPRIKNPEMGN